MNTKQLWILALLLLAPTAEAAKTLMRVNKDGSFTKVRPTASQAQLRTTGDNGDNNDPIDDFPELQPVRMARGTIHFIKSSVVVSDDNVSYESSRVCTREIEIPVFDARGLEGGYSWMIDISAECSTLVEDPMGLPTRLKLEASSAIWFSTWGDSDRKTFSGSLYADGLPTNTDPFSDSYASTRETGLEHLEMQLSKIKGAERQVGGERRYQEFYATVELIDEAASK